MEEGCKGPGGGGGGSRACRCCKHIEGERNQNLPLIPKMRAMAEPATARSRAKGRAAKKEVSPPQRGGGVTFIEAKLMILVVLSLWDTRNRAASFSSGQMPVSWPFRRGSILFELVPSCQATCDSKSRQVKSRFRLFSGEKQQVGSG